MLALPELFERLTAPHPSVTNVTDRYRAQFLAAFVLVVLPVALVAVFVQTYANPAFRSTGLMLIPGMLGMAAAYPLARSKHHASGVWISLVSSQLMVLQATMADPGNPAIYSYFALSGVWAGALLRPTLLYIYLVASAGIGVGMATFQAEALGPIRAISTASMISIFLIVIALVNWHRGVVKTAIYLENNTRESEARTKLLQADRMASMGRLAAGVAHEINNPLAYVSGNLELLYSTLEGEQLEAVSSALEGARRVQRIVLDLKTFSRIRTGEQRAVDPVQVAKASANMARHVVERRGNLVEQYFDAPSIDGDETRLGQVMLNLLINAAEALPEGDEGTVSVVIDTLSNGHVRIRVSDSGPGIPEELHATAFESSFTTKQDGTGLGLALSQSIVLEMGGTISIGVAEIGGAAITVTLPAGLLSGEIERTPAPARSPLLDNRARVLIVDDEPALQELLLTALQEHDVIAVGNAADALEAEAKGSFDLILCDVMMPGMNGLELFTHIAERNPGSERRILFLTGGTQNPATSQFLKNIPNYVLRKPFRLAVLREAVQGALDELASAD